MKIFAAMSILLLIGVVSAVPVNPCTKHTIDGNLADWGLNLTQNWSQNGTWLPNSGVYFVVEDNYNPNYADPSRGEPAGVHIRGVGNSSTFYDEPKVPKADGTPVAEPFGGESYDLEAFYFDEDTNCYYVAVVTSESPNAQGEAAPGDLAMNFDNDLNTGKWGYEYGVKLKYDPYGEMPRFGLYSMPDWQEPAEIPSNRPGWFSGGNYLGQVNGIYTDIGIPDNGYPNYVIELAIPKSAVNYTNVNIGNFHLSETCGNDHIPAPEFPFILVPLAITAIAPVLGYYISRKQN